MCRLLATLALCCMAAPTVVWADAVKATLDYGTVIGVSADQVRTFKGVPYAAPPVGPLRWRAPTPVPRWTGERQAVDYGASCAQGERPAFTPRTSQGSLTSE